MRVGPNYIYKQVKCFIDLTVGSLNSLLRFTFPILMKCIFCVPIAAKSTDFSRDFLFPGDKLVHLSDYKMKGFPENNFRYPRIPYAMRDHYLGRHYRFRENIVFYHIPVHDQYTSFLTIPPHRHVERKLGTQNQQNVYGHAHHHHIDEGKPDLWDSTAMDIDMSEIRQWKDLQRRNAADEEFRRKMERHKVLRLLQEEVAAERVIIDTPLRSICHFNL